MPIPLTQPRIAAYPSGEIIVHVCCMCYPGKTVLKDFPCLEGIPIGHGICGAHEPIHRARIMDEVNKSLSKAA